MQQVATKGSQIAALPIDLEVQPSHLVNNNDQFRQALDQTTSQTSDKTKQGGITPVWKAPEKKYNPEAHSSERITSDRAQTHSNKKDETYSATTTRSEYHQSKPIKPEPADQSDDTNWLELVESVKEFNENPDKAALANVAESVSGEEANLSDELAAKIDALLAKLGEDNSINNDEMSMLAVIQQQLDGMETDSQSPITLLALFDTIAKQLNDMVAKAVESGTSVESPKATALAAAMLTLHPSQSDTGDAFKNGSFPLDAISSADDVEGAAKLMVALMQAESQKQKSTTQSSSQDNLTKEKVSLPLGMDKLLHNMQQLSEEGQQESAEVIAERVLKLLPANVTEQQQQMIKKSVITGLNEINAQLAQGREPGISLQDMIAGALNEANIQLDNTMKQQLEGQLALLNNAMQTAQQAVATDIDRQAIASIDTSLRENSQLRSEMTKGQQAADGLDKPVNVQRPEGQQQLSEKVRWMINSRSSLAEIRLDPPELGSMQVRVNISGDTANVNFVVQTQHAKDALAEAENRLRDMLAEQGITLGESFVQHQNAQQDGDEERHFGGTGHHGESLDEEQPQPEIRAATRDTDGIDDYA